MLDRVEFQHRPQLSNATMIVALSGWMDGGEVSTGTAEYLAGKLSAKPVAAINGEGLYLHHFPGSMEIAALFRPEVKLSGGMIESFDMPVNQAWACEEHNIVIFSGHEPHVCWQTFCDSIYALADACDVHTLFFVGSFAGLVPHTRLPRIHSFASDQALLDEMVKYRARPSEYEGPSGIATLLTAMAAEKSCRMANIVAEIPAYVQGKNVKCIETVVRMLISLLGLPIDVEDLRVVADEMERRINETIEDREELHEHIKQLEEDYDNDVFSNEMGDLQEWLHRQGIRLD